MKILVISDIHANLTALDAVLADAGKVDQVWCLGDIIGYGPDPNECIDRIHSLPNLVCQMGNHDIATIGEIPLAAFNTEARKSLNWQVERLKPKNLQILSALERGVTVHEEVTLVHGSPRDSIWEYVLTTLIARLNLSSFETLWCFVGHTHFQAIFQYNSSIDDFSIEVPKIGSKYEWNDRAILNPGSVGQPRDRDPRAAYAFYYPETRIWEPRRVEYDIHTVQERIQKAELPLRHAERLAGGW